MNRLFWGLLLCLLDSEITVGTAVIGLLPDFLGFFLVMKGMQELSAENRFFDRGRHLAFGMILLSAICYGADLMNPASQTAVWLWGLELIGVIILLILIRMIITGILWLEHDNGLQLRGSLLKTLWKILIVICPLCQIFSWIPLVGDVCRMASFVVSALFLAVFWDSRRAFYGKK